MMPTRMPTQGTPRPRGEPDCARCTRLKDCNPELVVKPVESYVNRETGRRVRTGLCRDCNDVEWSERWARYRELAQAAGDTRQLQALERAKTRRIACGRKVYA